MGDCQGSGGNCWYLTCGLGPEHTDSIWSQSKSDLELKPGQAALWVRQTRTGNTLWLGGSPVSRATPPSHLLVVLRALTAKGMA